MENITETIKKFVDPTFREMKRQVNLKILKVSVIEQKVLDATDNGPSGPDDLALAEIAQATETLSGCHMVMDVLWTRLSETGNNWRRVYKSLAVIKYLVRNGSEYAVRDIGQHNSQISALASFNIY